MGGTTVAHRPIKKGLCAFFMIEYDMPDLIGGWIGINEKIYRKAAGREIARDRFFIMGAMAMGIERADDGSSNSQVGRLLDLLCVQILLEVRPDAARLAVYRTRLPIPDRVFIGNNLLN